MKDEHDCTDHRARIGTLIISVGLLFCVVELRNQVDALKLRLPVPTSPAPDQAAERDKGYKPTVTERIERVGK